MKEIKIKPVMPVYLVGVTWVIYAIFFPLYRITDCIIALCLSAAVYLISSRIIPEKTLLVPVAYKKTGDAETDNIVGAGQSYIKRLNELHGAIPQGVMSGHIGKLIQTSERIFDFISKHPSNARQIRSFMDYYFPTAIKLLESYRDIAAQPVKTENMTETADKIEGVMDSITAAFDKQLDMLYEDKAIDITTDIEVLKKMLTAEGLGNLPKGGGRQ